MTIDNNMTSVKYKTYESMETQMRKLLVFMVAFIIPNSVDAYPKKCIGDDANSQVVLLRGKECDVKCLAMAANNVPKNSYVIQDGMDKIPRQINGKCKAEDGSAGAAGHGTICFPLRTLKFVTPCNVKKDLYD